MKSKYIKLIFSFVLVSILIWSCATRNEYSTPKEIADGRLFRTDMLPEDSTSTGELSWRDFFTDPVLQKHIEEGLENNLDIRIALENISSAEAYLKQNKALYQPTLSFGPGYTFQTQSLNTQFGQLIGDRRYVNQFDLTVRVGWEADLWGKLKSQEKAQLASYLGSIEAHKLVKSELVSAIASSYYRLLALDEQKVIIQETIALREKNLETTKALKEAGTLTEVAVQQSEALVYNAQALLIDLDVQINLLENTISFLKGEPSSSISRNKLSTQQIPENLQLGYPARLLANRPDIRRAEFALLNAFEMTNAARAQFYPSLRITGSAGLQSLDIDHLFSVNSLFASIVGGLTQPLLNQRQIRTQYEVSENQKRIAYHNFRKAMLNAGREVSDVLKIYSAQDQFINLKEKERISYQKSVIYSQELVNYGYANYLEVLNANVNLLNTELSLVNAKYTKLKAGIDLYQSLGGGWK